MAKLIRTYRITPELDQLIKAEAERLTELQGDKVSEADVLELAVVKWCSSTNSVVDLAPVLDRHAVAEVAMNSVASVSPTPPEKPRVRAESVAERKARQAKEHAAALAESDQLARAVGRSDIEYDLENTTNRSGLPVGFGVKPVTKHHYPIAPRKVRPLTRPHGSTESKKRG